MWGGVASDTKDASLPISMNPLLYQDQILGFPVYQNAELSSSDLLPTDNANHLESKFSKGLSWDVGILNDPSMNNATKIKKKDGSLMNIQFSAGDYTNLINTMMAEKMTLENALQDEENKKMNNFSDFKVSFILGFIFGFIFIFII